MTAPVPLTSAGPADVRAALLTARAALWAQLADVDRALAELPGGDLEAPPASEDGWDARRALILRSYTRRTGRHLTDEDVIREASAFYAIPAEILRAETREQPILRARHMTIFLVQWLLRANYSELGRAFDRDHTTIKRAIASMMHKLQSDPDVGRELLAIERRIGGEPVAAKVIVSLPTSGMCCNAGLRVDFVYDSSTHDPAHAAVKGGERRGLCMTQPSRHPSTMSDPDGGLCRDCQTQIEKVAGVYRVKAVAKALHRRPFLSEREEGGWG